MITVVSGLPRSGTSMMMKMLEAGGMKVLTDNLRSADEDNLKGYYEDERVKALHQDNAWIGEAEDKVVKVISYLLKHLPEGHEYRIIFMERKTPEILASQKKMMQRRGEPTDDVPDQIMTGIFQKHLDETNHWLGKQHNMQTLFISYNESLDEPEAIAEKVNTFLGHGMNIEKMMQVVDPSLYRQRK
jgi:broad-specificity NMP kinase